MSPRGPRGPRESSRASRRTCCVPGRRGVRGLRPAGDLAGCEDVGVSSEEAFGLDDSADMLDEAVIFGLDPVA